MFSALSDKLQTVFDNLGRKGHLTEADVDVAMRELRMALLEADVSYGVVKDIAARVRARAVGAEVLRSLTPAQQVVTIVHDALVDILGKSAPLDIGRGDPPVILMAGLQGSGKTTTAAKLALMLRKKGKRPLLVACDTRRPAAVEQLAALGRQLDLAVYSEGTAPAPPDIAARSLEHARHNAHDVVIVDTSGRLQIDEALMDELVEIARRVQPTETLLVADAMTGQEAVNVAQAFHARLALTGLVLTKVDGDARGGAALSIRAVTGVPIKFLGAGEKANALEPFEPERLAGRILGMGDIQTLLERAQSTIDEDEAARLEKKLRKGTVDLQDFLGQLQQIQRMGPIQEILGLIPGFGKLTKQLPVDLDPRDLKRVEAIILSMTPQERRKPKILNASRKRRIASGSGTRVQDVNQLLQQFDQMQRMLKQFSGGRLPRGLPWS
ncbi:signal recognition particle protein [bacterium]|nr:signal recognition particle protein [Chloroflexi bacterium CFX6]RIL11808.1 MAG: signal recognition particle protein [bacterium]